MSKIIEIRKEVVRFLKENIHVNDVRVIRIIKDGDLWKTVAEVYEEDSFLKSMNFPTKKARLYYSVTVDSELEIRSYNRFSNYDDNDSQFESN